MSDLKKQLKKQRELVWEQIDPAKMEEFCLTPEASFSTLGTVTQTKDGPYIYIDNGSDILFVAHLDVVLDTDIFEYVAPKRGKGVGFEYAFSPMLDDRLGVYVGLDLLPRLGIKCDVLLTTGEETGHSTAAYFNPEKNYNWMFQFDRHGADVVMYQFDSKPSRAKLSRFGFTPAEGSFSDIGWLDHLGVVGFNFGTGYHDEHYINCYASVNELVEQVSRFTLFYKEYAHTMIPFDYDAYVEKRKLSKSKGLSRMDYWGHSRWDKESQSYRAVHDSFHDSVDDFGRLAGEAELDAAFDAQVEREVLKNLGQTPDEQDMAALERCERGENSQCHLESDNHGRVKVTGHDLVNGGEVLFSMGLSAIRPFLLGWEYNNLSNPPASLTAWLPIQELIEAAGAEHAGRYA